MRYASGCMYVVYSSISLESVLLYRTICRRRRKLRRCWNGERSYWNALSRSCLLCIGAGRIHMTMYVCMYVHVLTAPMHRAVSPMVSTGQRLRAVHNLGSLLSHCSRFLSERIFAEWLCLLVHTYMQSYVEKYEHS